MIRHRWLSRTAAGAGLLALVLFGARSGWADAAKETPIGGVSLPVTAAEFSDRTIVGFTGYAGRRCEPSTDEDVWFFAAQRPRVLVSVTLTFAVPGGDQRVETIGADGNGEASVRTPAGWTLVAATAQVGESGAPRPNLPVSESPEPEPGVSAGDATPSVEATHATPSSNTTSPPSTGTAVQPSVDATSRPGDGGARFVLAGTCPAERIFAASGSAVKPNGKPTPHTTPRRSVATPTPASPAPAPATGTAAAAGNAPAGAAARLPITGLDITGMFTVGASLVFAGVLLLIVRRQRQKPLPKPEPSDWY